MSNVGTHVKFATSHRMKRCKAKTTTHRIKTSKAKTTTHRMKTSKTKTTTQKTIQKSSTDPSKTPQRHAVLANGQMTLFLIHATPTLTPRVPCLSYSQVMSVIEERRYLRKITKIHCHLRNRYFVTALFCVMLCRSLFVFLSCFLLVITVSVILRFAACDNNLFYPFKLFFYTL